MTAGEQQVPEHRVAPAQRPGKQQRWKEGPAEETQISRLKTGDMEGTPVQISGDLLNLPAQWEAGRRKREPAPQLPHAVSAAREKTGKQMQPLIGLQS